MAFLHTCVAFRIGSLEPYILFYSANVPRTKSLGFSYFLVSARRELNGSVYEKKKLVYIPIMSISTYFSKNFSGSLKIVKVDLQPNSKVNIPNPKAKTWSNAILMRFESRMWIQKMVNASTGILIPIFLGPSFLCKSINPGNSKLLEFGFFF